MTLTQRLDLAGRVAVVSGGARGIGLACCRALAGQGARVVVADVDGAAAEAAAAELGAAGALAEAAPVDVTDEAAVAAMIDGVVARHGRLDIAVANAGVGARQPAETMPLADWQRVLDVNLTGSFLVARLAARAMLARGPGDGPGEGSGGAIVLVASIMGLVGGGLYPNAAYHASKAGIVNLARALALEWAQRGIRVNAVAPAFVRTRLTENLLGSELGDAVVAATPMGRLVEPEEVADAVAFLASDAAAMITGTTLPVDGGWLAQ